MTRIPLLLALIVMTAGTCVIGAPAQSTAKGVTPPPALNMPYSARVVTDLNISDNDLLGVAKQTLPGVVRTMLPFLTGKAASGLGKPVDEKDLDPTPLLDSISRVTSLRAIVAKLPKTATKAQIMKDVEAGVAKIGKFGKVLADTRSGPGFGLLFAQSDNAGYIGFIYDADQNTLYAGRAVGSVDVSKLTTWATNLLTKYGVGVTTQLTPAVPAESEGQQK